MSGKKYNGWSNYETWAVNLWIDNDEYLCQEFNSRAHHFFDNYQAERKLAGEIETRVNEMNPLNDASMYTDILNNGLTNVDYYEIAEAFLKEVDFDEEGVEYD